MAAGASQARLLNGHAMQLSVLAGNATMADEAWRCGVSAGSGGVRVEAGQGVIWDRFAPVLRGLVEKSNGFRTAMEAFRSKISGRYFVTCAYVRYPRLKDGFRPSMW